MDKSIEEKFVKKFILKDKRERTIFELGSRKKRIQTILRLVNYADERYAILCDSKIKDADLLKRITDFYNINSDCYVIAEHSDDGKKLPFKTAFENMCDGCGVYVIICNENLVVMKDEVVYGAPVKMLLYRKD